MTLRLSIWHRKHKGSTNDKTRQTSANIKSWNETVPRIKYVTREDPGLSCWRPFARCAVFASLATIFCNCVFCGQIGQILKYCRYILAKGLWPELVYGKNMSAIAVRDLKSVSTTIFIRRWALTCIEICFRCYLKLRNVMRLSCVEYKCSEVSS